VSPDCHSVAEGIDYYFAKGIDCHYVAGTGNIADSDNDSTD
jgi:hypothetical protein